MPRLVPFNPAIPLDDEAQAPPAPASPGAGGPRLRPLDPNVPLDPPQGFEVDPSQQLVETNPLKFSSERPAGLGTIAAASLAQEPEARINFFAEQMGIPRSRFSIRRGTIVYKGDDGKIYRVIPEADVSSPMSVAKNIAQGVGPSIPAATGTIGGILSAPLALSTGGAGLPASMAITAASGAAGQGLREKLAELITGQQPSGTRIATEGGIAGLTQGIGAGPLIKGAQGLVGRTSPITGLRSQTPQRKAMTDLIQRGERRGIQMTPAEASGLGPLRAQQKQLGNLTESAETLENFYRTRAKDIQREVFSEMDNISIEASGAQAGRNIQSTASAAIEAAKQERRDIAQPLYQRAVNSGVSVDIGDLVGNIERQIQNSIPSGTIAKSLNRARGFLTNLDEATDQLVPETRIGRLHQAKLEIDGLIENADKKGIVADAQRRLVEIKNGLVSAMEEASPDYREARLAFQEASGPVDALEKGVVGAISRLKSVEAQQAARTLFSPTGTSPEAVIAAKKVLRKTNPKAWQDIKRAWLQDQWDTAGRETLQSGADPITQGPKWRNLLLGDERKRRIMRSMLDPKEFKTLDELARILEGIGKIKFVGSDTAFNQEMNKQARAAATPAVAKIARTIRFTEWGKLIEEYATERGMSRNARKVADIITQPGAENRIRELEKLIPKRLQGGDQLSPASARFIAGVAHLLTRGSTAALFGGADDLDLGNDEQVREFNLPQSPLRQAQLTGRILR